MCVNVCMNVCECVCVYEVCVCMRWCVYEVYVYEVCVCVCV